MVNIYRALLLEQYAQDIISRQEDRGWQFDKDLAEEYINSLESESKRLHDLIIPNLSLNVVQPYKTPINRPFLKSGAHNSYVIKWMGEEDAHLVGGPFTRVRFEEPNLDSDKQLKEQLFKLGWEPDEWNYKKNERGKIEYINGEPIPTSPKLTESSYDSLSAGIGPDLALYLKVSMRLSSIRGWLSQVREDGTISARANVLGTPTARMRHRGVVNVPKNDPKVFFGKECRSLFTHRPGRKLVGHDASGLEGRMEAHAVYPFSQDYADELLNGDMHWQNVRTLFFQKESEGLTKKDPEGNTLRNKAKTGKYALIASAV